MGKGAVACFYIHILMVWKHFIYHVLSFSVFLETSSLFKNIFFIPIYTFIHPLFTLSSLIYSLSYRKIVYLATLYHCFYLLRYIVLMIIKWIKYIKHYWIPYCWILKLTTSNKRKGKWKLLPGIEEITKRQAHTNTWKLYRDISTGMAVFLNRKRANICEHTTKMVSLEI